MAAEDGSIPYGVQKRPDLVIENQKRLDGRTFEEFRNVVLKTGVISQAAGSSYAEFGTTKVMVGVYGPREPNRRTTASHSEGRLNVDIKYATFASQQKKLLRQSPEEREMSAALQTALEPSIRFETFPKLTVNVYCTILEAGGSELAVAITAASAAIADAGIEMNDLVTACSVAKVQGALVLDPSSDESYREEGEVVLALMTLSNQVTQLMVQGRWQDGELKEAFELGLGGCGQLDEAVRHCLIEAAQAVMDVSPE